MIKKIGKGLKKFMNEKIEICKEVISSDQKRLTLGIVLIGFGVGMACLGGSLITSAYVHAPAI